MPSTYCLGRPQSRHFATSTSPAREATYTRNEPPARNRFLLAGSNRAPDGGILTAREVAVLDLGGVELATLSACETGLGETAGGEGLLGLQRAFQVAGARSVVASLWQVPDADTQRLMGLFYDNLWHKKMGRLEALRQAQLTLLRDPYKATGNGRGFEVGESRSEGVVCADPYRWAAWVLSGDPGDLTAVAPVSQDTEAVPVPPPPQATGGEKSWWPWFAGGAAVGTTLAGLSVRRWRRRVSTT